LWNSLLGKKLIAAFTGLILLLFLVGHMAGNLKVLLGADPEGTPDIDLYGRFLRTAGEPVLHVIVVIQLSVANRRARPIAYARSRTRVSTLAAKSMMVSGLALLLFVSLHVLHLTTGTIQFGPFEHGSVYANLYESFRRPVVAVAYIGFMICVGLHVWHGGWSFFQSWGIDRPGWNPFWRKTATALALALALGFSLVPFLFMFDLLPTPTELMESTKALGD
jgi:succinate dehydrogenase / fumarate reductase cytochrome b subunit